MLKLQRHEVILRELQSQEQASLNELAQLLGASPITIRRDLEALEQAGQIRRIRGGAQRLHPVNPDPPEPPIVQRQLLQSLEKQAIGLKACELVTDGDVIALEAGSTTLEMARALARQTWQNLQVITNNFLVNEILIRTPGVRTIFLGGVVSRDELGTFGVLTEEMLKHMSFNRLFVGCRGIDARMGVSHSIESQIEVSTVRAMAAAASETFILADHTKFGQTFLIRMLPISAITGIVVDSNITDEQLAKLQEQDLRILVAPVPSPVTPGAASG